VTAELVVIDTDVASGLSQEREAAAAGPDAAAIALTFVTVGELHRGAEHAGWGGRRRAELEQWIDRQPFIPADYAIARRWGEMTGALLRAGRPLPVNDSWIAACCLHHDVPLMTHNPADFAGIEGLRLITPE
jgi:predicted nucleic acid-binding protein